MPDKFQLIQGEHFLPHHWPSTPAPVNASVPAYTMDLANGASSRRAFLSALSAAGLSVLLPSAFAQPKAKPNAQQSARQQDRAPKTAWQAFVSPFGHVYPALLLAASRVKAGVTDTDEAEGLNLDGLIGIRINPNTHQTLSLQLQCAELKLDQTWRFRLDGKQSLFTPNIRWNREWLGSIRTTMTSEMAFTVQLDRDPPIVYREPVVIHPATDVLYFVEDTARNIHTDLNWLFAAFVDERHALIRDIVESAKRSGLVKQFQGYRNAELMDVHNQVFALWDVLRLRKFQYAPLAKRTREHSALFSQRIRPLPEALTQARANCADGSVLIASLLRAIGLHARLVLVPGHMFVAYSLNASASQFAYIETTFISEKIDPTHTEGLTPDEIAFTHFYAAVSEGQRRFQIASKKFTRNNPAYQLIDIDAARRLGVQSIVADLS